MVVKEKEEMKCTIIEDNIYCFTYYIQENIIFYSIYTIFNKKIFSKYTSLCTKEYKLYNNLLYKISLETELLVSDSSRKILQLKDLRVS